MKALCFILRLSSYLGLALSASTVALFPQAGREKVFHLPASLRPDALCWSPEGKSLFVGLQNANILILPQKKKLLVPSSVRRNWKGFRFIRLGCSPTGKDLAALIGVERKGGRYKQELWKFALPSGIARCVDTDVHSFGWAKRLIYVKDLGDGFTCLKVDWGDGKSPTALSVAGLGRFLTAVSMDGRAVIGRQAVTKGLKPLPIKDLWFCRVEMPEGRILWKRDLNVGELPDLYVSDWVEWSETEQAGVVSWAASTDGVSNRQLLIVTKERTFNYVDERTRKNTGSDKLICLLSAPYWADGKLVFVEGIVGREQGRLVIFDPSTGARVTCSKTNVIPCLGVFPKRDEVAFAQRTDREWQVCIQSVKALWHF